MNLPVPVETVAGEIVFDGSARPARADWGRWIADCSGPYCRNAWKLQPGQTSWACNLCGVVTDVVWPADPGAIEFLLMMRPDPATRNWAPPEPVEQLLLENVQHDVAPEWLINSLESIPDVLTIVDGRVVSGALLAGIEERRVLFDQGRLFAITAGGAS